MVIWFAHVCEKMTMTLYSVASHINLMEIGKLLKCNHTQSHAESIEVF